METLLLAVDAVSPQRDGIARAAAVIVAGGLVAFPTETVYGLGADALDAAAVERIFVAKGRPATNPLIVHVNSSDQAARLTLEWPDDAARLADRFWPGPLTLVLRKQSFVPDAATAGLATVAVRSPAHPVARALIEAVGVPIAAPSANRSTRVSPTLASHVLRGLDGRIEMILDAGPTPGGIESTVLDLSSSEPRILRPGLIGVAQIEAVLGRRIARPGPTDSPHEPARSPGMSQRHYAPPVPLETVSEDAVWRLAELAGRGERFGWLTCGETAFDPPTECVHLALPADPMGYSAALYAALHALIDQGVRRIVVSLPPQGDAWLAIHDRLRRASWGP